jgi:hypothetical protein
VTDAAESQHTLAVRKLQALAVRKKSHFLSDVAIYQHRPTTPICRQHTQLSLYIPTLPKMWGRSCNTAVCQQFEFATSVAEQRSHFSVSVACTCYKFDTWLTRPYRKVSHIRHQDFSPQESVNLLL